MNLSVFSRYCMHPLLYPLYRPFCTELADRYVIAFWKDFQPLKKSALKGSASAVAAAALSAARKKKAGASTEVEDTYPLAKRCRTLRELLHEVEGLTDESLEPRVAMIMSLVRFRKLCLSRVSRFAYLHS